MSYPRFDEPRLTRPIAEILDDFGLSLAGQKPLPLLGEPSSEDPVDAGVEEPMSPIEHGNILVLENYRKAGWPSSVDFCKCRSSVFDALVSAESCLPDDFGLAIFDAWRPPELQLELYDAALEDPTIPEWLVAMPSNDPLTPPPHVSGGAIDLTLTVRGTPVELGTMFDDATERARAGALEGEPGPAREGRRLLYWAMRSAGFVVFSEEWWHFELGTRRWAAITGGQARFGAGDPRVAGRPSPTERQSHA